MQGKLNDRKRDNEKNNRRENDRRENDRRENEKKYKKYEKQVSLYKEIPIEPHLLICNTNRIIKDKIWEMMKRHCSGEYGFVLRLDHIDKIETGAVDTTTGSIIYPVNFTITAFKPNVGDILDATVTDVTKSGFFCEFGPLEIYVPCSNIPIEYAFRINDSIGQFENKDKIISKDKSINVKICAIQKINTQQINESLLRKTETIYRGGILSAIGEVIELVESIQ